MLLTLFTSLFALMTPGETTLTLSLDNIGEKKGFIYLTLYGSAEGFMDVSKAIEKRVIEVQQAGKLSVALKNLPAGEYAVSCYHDLNGNGKLDTNFLGIPTEPYGFSNNARPKFRAPNWDEARFKYKGGVEDHYIRLEKW